MNANAAQCAHRFETKVDHRLHEVIKSCKACEHVEVSTLNAVNSGASPKDLWKLVAGEAA